MHAPCLVVRSDVAFTRPVLESVLGWWGVSLTRPVMEYFSSFGGWGVCLTRHFLETVRSSSGESLLQDRVQICLFVRRVGSLSYMPYTGNYLISRRLNSLCHVPRATFCVVV